MATDIKKRSFTEGPLFFKMIMFALPIIATGILQTLYTMADNIVVGRFSGDETALGSVGSTGALTNLTINLLIGISAGTSVVIAQAYGAKQDKIVSRAVHTALSFSLIGGIAFMILGLALSGPMLHLMGTKDAYIDGAKLYFRIICLGIPATSIYNFGAAILRSVGDSKTPLILLATTGLVNVGLNFLFVLAFHMTVSGVALATIISQYLSAISVVAVLMKKRGQCYTFSFKMLCFDWRIFARILRFGIPSGLQSSLFSISNVILTGGVNTLASVTDASGALRYSDTVVTAYTISGNIDAITFTTCNSFHHAAMTFVGQNYGAKKPDRIKKIILFSLLQVIFFGILISQTELLLAKPLISLYVDPRLSADMITRITEQTIQIMRLLLNVYFLCGIMDVLSGIAKGLSYSITPMIMSLTGICGLRILWVFAVFPSFKTIEGLLVSYPISWGLTIILLGSLVIFAVAKFKKTFAKKKEDTPSEEPEEQSQ